MSDPFDVESFRVWQNAQIEVEDIESEKFTNLVRKVIQKELTDDERELIRLYYYKGLSSVKIADIVGVDSSTVRRRLYKVHQKLYNFLKYAAELYFGRSM